MKPLYQLLFVGGAQSGRALNEGVEVVFPYGIRLGRLNAFKVEQAGALLVHAVERGHEVAFKEKLECDVASVFVEEQAQAPLPDEIQRVGHAAFAQQDGFRGYGAGLGHLAQLVHVGLSGRIAGGRHLFMADAVGRLFIHK